MYEYQIALDNTFKNIVISEYKDSLIYTFNPKSVDYATEYWWRARTVDAVYGSKSAWADTCKFTTVGTSVSLDHTTAYLYLTSLKNVDVMNGINCRELGQDLNNLRLEVNYPVNIPTSASDFIGNDLNNLNPMEEDFQVNY